MDTKKWHIVIEFDFVGDARIFRYKTVLAESFKGNFIKHYSKMPRNDHLENVEITVTKPK